MIKKLLGHVGVDSSQLLITDPCYIDSEWEKKDFKDIRIYKHKTKNITFEYESIMEDEHETLEPKAEKFNSYEQIMSTGKTMNQMLQEKEVEELVPKEKQKLINTMSYAGICETTMNDQHIINFKLGHEGAAIAFNSGFGDGFYPVYGLFNDEGRCMKVEIDCEMLEEHKALFNKQEENEKS